MHTLAQQANHNSSKPTEVPPNIPPTTFQDKRNKSSRLGKFKGSASTLAILIIAPLIALSLTAFVFQSYEVDGPSMQTTLQNHDRLIVTKTARTWAKITGNPYIPDRGDIVIFNKQDVHDFGTSSKKQLIKRVVGLPGERVVIIDGVLRVFNREHPDGFEPDKSMDYGKTIKSTSGNVDVTLGKDQVFVSGDNRDNSLDSRSFGPISANDIVGRVSLRIFPIGNAEKF